MTSKLQKLKSNKFLISNFMHEHCMTKTKSWWFFYVAVFSYEKIIFNISRLLALITIFSIKEEKKSLEWIEDVIQSLSHSPFIHLFCVFYLAYKLIFSIPWRDSVDVKLKLIIFWHWPLGRERERGERARENNAFWLCLFRC